MSDGQDVRGPWNEGAGPWTDGAEWEYVHDPVSQVRETHGQRNKAAPSGAVTAEQTHELEEELSRRRSERIKQSMPKGEAAWYDYS